MPLYTEIPRNDPSLHAQTRLTDLSLQDFKNLFAAPDPSIPIRIYRLFCFIGFLGPVKILVCCVGFVLFSVAVSVLPLFRPFFGTERSFKTWAFRIVRPIMRLFLFGLGVVSIKVHGSIRPDVRTIVSNHMSLLETVILLQQFPVSYVAAEWLGRTSLIRRTAKVFDFVYVNRAKHQGGAAQLTAIANDPTLLPVVVFPEGKVTNGDAILAFRTGAFVSPSPVQPVTIRYRMWLTPKSMGSWAWNEDRVPWYVYQVFAIPFTTAEVDILEPMAGKNSDIPAHERAVETQIRIANHLGTIATSRSNKELFTEEDRLTVKFD